jgi:Ca-activated chloride channel family protein
MTFDTPTLAWLAPLFGLVVAALALWARAARVSHARRWSPTLGRRAARLGRLGPIGLALAAAAAGVALAGPRWGSRVVTTETKGLNVVIAVDISRSMLAEDAAPSRLERAKNQARRIVQDFSGDRIGLIAFAGQSFILSPLTVDGGALNLLIDALDPDLTSAGGTEIARALRQARDLLFAGDPIADRVLVMFTDGEAHDTLQSIQSAAENLRRDGVRLILVAEGGVEPETIPVRDADGRLIGQQRDPSGETVQTTRRDDVLTAIADEAHGVVVPAEHGDQAGAVQDLVSGYKRSPQATSTAAQDISRAWLLALVAVAALLAHAMTRRSMALASLLLLLGAGEVLAQGRRNAADDAWVRGDFRAAAEQYLKQVRAGEGGDTSWYNLGTAALALLDSGVALRGLERATRSLDPDLRFRALYNRGLLALQLARLDSANASQHLETARQQYQEALLLRPGDREAKWNLELTIRQQSESGGGGGGGGGQGSGGSGGQPREELASGLTPNQAAQILNSMAEEERRTLLDRNKRSRQARESRGRKDW